MFSAIQMRSVIDGLNLIIEYPLDGDSGLKRLRFANMSKGIALKILEDNLSLFISQWGN